MTAFRPGDRVHVEHFGAGVIREARNQGRYLVDVKGTTMVVDAEHLSRVDEQRTRRRRHASSGPVPVVETPPPMDAPSSIDLHGRTVDEAVALVDAFLNDALLAGLTEVRIIHGRSGGRVRAAVEHRLKQLPVVRRFALDPRNPGVTIAWL